MILPGCTRGHIRARYVLQGYLIRIFYWPSVGLFSLLAISGPFFFIMNRTAEVIQMKLHSPKCDFKT